MKQCAVYIRFMAPSDEAAMKFAQRVRDAIATAGVIRDNVMNDGNNFAVIIPEEHEELNS